VISLASLQLYPGEKCQLLWIEGCRMVSEVDPLGRNFDFLDRNLGKVKVKLSP
jgi:hypothetical protein